MTVAHQETAQQALAALRAVGVRGLLFAAFLSLFTTMLGLVVPMFMLQVYDRVLGSRSVDTLTVLAMVAVGALVLYGILDYIRGRTYHVVGNNIAERLSLPVLRRSVASAARGGKTTVTQAMRDLLDLRNFVSGTAVGVLLDMIWAPVFLIVLWLLHPMFVLTGVCAAVLLVTVGVIAAVVTRRPLNAASQRATETYRELGQSRSQAEAIEAMGMVGPLARRWSKEHALLTADYDRAGQLGKAFSSATRSLRSSIQILVLALGAYLVIGREVTPGTMMAASILTGRLLQPFEQAVESWRQWMFARRAYQRLIDLLSSPDLGADSMPLPRPEGRVSAEKLTFYPAGAPGPVLRDVSFSLEPGEVLGIIGPSGAGKSTLAKSIVGLIKPTSGGVFLDDHGTRSWERESFGQHVGYLPQSVSLLDGSIRDNIARMSDRDPELVVEAARAAGIHDVIGRLPDGYETLIGPNGFSLSGGQLQRIGLARAVFDSPALLVLDEPNSNLDSDGEAALDRVIQRAKAAGTTVIIVAHRPAAVAQADKLLVLVNGVIDQFGSKADVLRGGKVLAPSVRGVPALHAPGQAPDSQQEALSAPQPAALPAAKSTRGVAAVKAALDAHSGGSAS